MSTSNDIIVRTLSKFLWLFEVLPQSNGDYLGRLDPIVSRRAVFSSVPFQ